MDISGVAKEIGNRYRDWHDMRHMAIMNWIREKLETLPQSNSQIKNLIIFPEGSIGRHQIDQLQQFVKDMKAHDITIIAGSHSFEYSCDTLNEYPEEIRNSDSDPYYGDNRTKVNLNEYNIEKRSDRKSELQRIASDPQKDTKQVIPIIHSDGTISLRTKNKLSPFERTNTSELLSLTGRETQEIEIKPYRFTKDFESYTFLPLICSEALQFLEKVNASVLCVIANHSKPTDFKHLNEQAFKNGIPAVLVNDGAYGGSGLFIIFDHRGENWWFGGTNQGALPKGDAILVFDLDLECTSPQTARANPRFPAGLAGLAAILPANDTDPHYFVSRELQKIKNYFEDNLKVGDGIDYNMIADNLLSLIHGRRGSPVQNIKLRRLLALATACNIDQRSVEILCSDCMFDIIKARSSYS